MGDKKEPYQGIDRWIPSDLTDGDDLAGILLTQVREQATKRIDKYISEENDLRHKLDEAIDFYQSWANRFNRVVTQMIDRVKEQNFSEAYDTSRFPTTEIQAVVRSHEGTDASRVELRIIGVWGACIASASYSHLGDCWAVHQPSKGNGYVPMDPSYFVTFLADVILDHHGPYTKNEIRPVHSTIKRLKTQLGMKL